MIELKNGVFSRTTFPNHIATLGKKLVSPVQLSNFFQENENNEFGSSENHFGIQRENKFRKF